MNNHWQRQRQPDDVPTPVAVAVSDFCRRAKAPASPTEVREALALLSEADDFRVRTLTDAEPAATPLGPFAVVDVLKGTDPRLAATRQGCGYYEVVQELVRVHEQKAPPAPVPPAPIFALPPAPPSSLPEVAPARPGKAAQPSKESIQQRIAPRKRPATEEAPEELEAETGLLKRELPKPRGRFTRLAPPRANYQELLRVEGRSTLEAALEQHEHRFALHRALVEQYNGPRGELELADLESVLRHHALLESLTGRERTALLAAYAEHRGAAGRVGWALGLSPSELRQLVAKLGMSEEIEEVRERFRREALTARHLTQRLDLLGRDKYLADLGIKKRFSDSLRKELESLVRDELPSATELTRLAETVSRKHGAPTELLLRAFERLGLTEELRKRISAASPHSSP